MILLSHKYERDPSVHDISVNVSTTGDEYVKDKYWKKSKHWQLTNTKLL